MKPSIKKTKFLPYIMLFVIIAVQLFRIIYSFVYLKEDYHSDEQWSFGLSNSYYNPFIYADDDCIKPENYNQWVSSDVFKNYMTVDKEHRFSYGSVFYNQEKDIHPPLYYLILHTICSFFPGKFSFWYGFVINIAAFILLQIFLYKTVKIISKSEVAALLCCFFYGASVGCMSTFVYIRMYALMAMFAVITTYFHAVLYYEQNLKKTLPQIFIITLCGCLTNHFFPVYAGVLSACFCLWYLLRKKYKQFIIYSVSMLTSVIASIAIFPATIPHLTSSRIEGIHYSTSWQIGMCFNFMTYDLFSFTVSIFSSALPSIIIASVLSVIILSLPVIFLFRKKINIIIVKQNIKKAFSIIINFIKNINLPVLFIFLASAASVVATALTVSIIRMSTHTNRYLFFIYPLVCSVFICVLHKLLSPLKSLRNKKLLSDVLICVLTISVTFYTNSTSETNSYFFEKEKGSIDMMHYIENSNCIFVNTEEWLITCFADKFIKTNMVYPVLSSNVLDASITLPDNNHPAYLIVSAEAIEDRNDIKKNQLEHITGAQVIQNEDFYNQYTINITEAELTKYISETTGKNTEYIGYDTVFGRVHNIYKLN